MNKYVKIITKQNQLSSLYQGIFSIPVEKVFLMKGKIQRTKGILPT